MKIPLKGDLVITRILPAPRPLVFRAWTEKEHFVRWFGPHSSTMPFCEMDARAGGTLHFCHAFSGSEVWARGTYLEVEPPERIVLAFHFSDREGNRVERPGFPLESTITALFEETNEGTRLTIQHAGLKFDQGEGEGWKEGLDRLEELLQKVA